eukprot:9822585-Alexandrium_andersonii.AAC.1
MESFWSCWGLTGNSTGAQWIRSRSPMEAEWKPNRGSNNVIRINGGSIRVQHGLKRGSKKEWGRND